MWLDPFFQNISTLLVNGIAATKERAVNLIAGSGVTITYADNPSAARTDVTITSTGGGGGAVTWAADLAGSTSTSQSIAAIRGNTVTGNVAALGNFFYYGTSGWTPAAISGDIAASTTTFGKLTVSSLSGVAGVLGVTATTTNYSTGGEIFQINGTEVGTLNTGTGLAMAGDPTTGVAFSAIKPNLATTYPLIFTDNSGDVYIGNKPGNAGFPYVSFGGTTGTFVQVGGVDAGRWETGGAYYVYGPMLGSGAGSFAEGASPYGVHGDVSINTTTSLTAAQYANGLITTTPTAAITLSGFPQAAAGKGYPKDINVLAAFAVTVTDGVNSRTLAATTGIRRVWFTNGAIYGT